VSAIEAKLRAAIEREGPIPFAAFMQAALYDPVHGYYRGQPFGPGGDFYTAAQLHPVFGALIRSCAELLLPAFTDFVDIGAGREDLRASFSPNVYRPVQHGQAIPKTKRGFLFSNELFDALPVEVHADGELVRVDWSGGQSAGRFFFTPPMEGKAIVEERPGAKEVLAAAYRSIDEGCYLIIDYGYLAGEQSLRFPQGSLMGYRKHLPVADVLLEPGAMDITAHVNWTDLMNSAEAAGWRVEWFRSLRSTILSLPPETLETLYFLGPKQFQHLVSGMGEGFETLLLRKPAGPKS
jgi:SAM-dependent MidA family methyltransferase